MARTSTPLATSAAVTCRPMNPVAPVTATRVSHQRFLVEAVGLVASGAEPLDGVIDVAIVLEHPRELRAPIRRVGGDLPAELRDEQRVNPGTAVRGEHAEEHQPDLRDDRLA